MKMEALDSLASRERPEIRDLRVLVDLKDEMEPAYKDPREK